MKAQERLIAVPILATERHCDNSCPGMSYDAKDCLLFHESLTWDKRKKTHGNKRLEACLKAERAHPL